MKRIDPDYRVIRLARLLEELVGSARGFDGRVLGRLGQWEADVEARNLIQLAACHGGGAATLVWSSASTLPAASVLARSCLDAGVVALWLLQPDDPFDREARWLLQLHSEIRARERIAAFTARHGQQREDAGLAAIREFHSAVSARMPPGRHTTGHMPDTRTLLDQLGLPEKYLAHVILSQHVHGTHYGTASYRRHLGTCKELGEFGTPADWCFVLSICWWFIATPVLKLASRYDIEASSVIADQLHVEFANAQAALAQ